METFAVSSPDERLEEFGREQSVRTYGIDMPRAITPGQDVRAVAELVRVLRANRPEIVHAHTPKGGLLGMISAWIARTPVRIYHMRGLPYMTATGRRRHLLKLTERLSCRLASRVFCVSHSLRDVAIRDGICPEDRIVVFGGGSGNGVDAVSRFDPARFDPEHAPSFRRRYGIGPEALVIGYVGRVVKDKGIHELATAWLRLRDRLPTAELVLAGTIEPQDPVDPAVLRALEGDERVHLIGSVKDTSELYPALDLVVLPSYREGLPNVPLEAAAMEIPVVATEVPGCVDAVRNGATGTLIPARDAASLQYAIERYLDNPGLRHAHGRAGRQRVLREFRQEAIWEAMYREYRQLLIQHDPGRGATDNVLLAGREQSS
jgi:glycosyltransferase involved in cell wall biosynthesis